jgi:hypothetical protein
MSKISPELKRVNKVILCSSLFLIAFILFYKWACMACPQGVHALSTGGYNIAPAQPFNLDKTWYVWISFILSQAFIQFYLLNFAIKKKES